MGTHFQVGASIFTFFTWLVTIFNSYIIKGIVSIKIQMICLRDAHFNDVFKYLVPKDFNKRMHCINLINWLHC